MDRAMLERHLRTARDHVELGEQHVTRQRELVAELDRDGHDTAMARTLLRTFEDMQATHVADRDRLIAEIKALPA